MYECVGGWVSARTIEGTLVSWARLDRRAVGVVQCEAAATHVRTRCATSSKPINSHGSFMRTAGTADGGGALAAAAADCSNSEARFASPEDVVAAVGNRLPALALPAVHGDLLRLPFPLRKRTSGGAVSCMKAGDEALYSSRFL